MSHGKVTNELALFITSPYLYSVQIQYDYIILGAGLSGLTTALRMIRDPFLKDKTIAIIDQDLNKGNDRTWCFWETTPGLYESVVSYSWPSILIKGNSLNTTIDIAPYTYKKVESADLYAFAKAELSQHSNITFIEARVKNTLEMETQAQVITHKGKITGSKVLNSLYHPETLENQKQNVVLQQHFIGWFVKTKEAVFNPKVATYMDFSVAQKGNCRFMYVLPTSNTEALLEYTLFSKDLLPKSEYNIAIKEYLSNLGVSEYEIIDREQGSIPMTTYDFTKLNTKHILHIGTAGGWTKASTGYTFKHTLKKSAKLIEFLKTGESFQKYTLENRWTFYDSVLLEVLAKHNDRGSEIFTKMFKEGKADHIFRFLDEESTFGDEMKVVLSAPKIPFMKAAFRLMLGRS